VNSLRILVSAGVLAVVWMMACGGGKSGKGADVGQHHAGGDDVDPIGQGAGMPDAAPEPMPDAGPPPPPVTFEIANTAPTDLTFSLNKGWQANVNAIGSAKKTYFFMYPKHCTASCDALDEDRCPVCEGHETSKDERMNQLREVVAAGATYALGWNGKAYAYEKARGTREGKKVKCECWREVEPQPGAYDVMICGKRETTAVGVSSKLQCEKTPLEVPLVETPVAARVEFAQPPEPPKKKGR
jgi:hypothetical protein